jgi:hypothetical protein
MVEKVKLILQSCKTVSVKHCYLYHLCLDQRAEYVKGFISLLDLDIKCKHRLQDTNTILETISKLPKQKTSKLDVKLSLNEISGFHYAGCLDVVKKVRVKAALNLKTEETAKMFRMIGNMPKLKKLEFSFDIVDVFQITRRTTEFYAAFSIGLFQFLIGDLKHHIDHIVLDTQKHSWNNSYVETILSHETHDMFVVLLKKLLENFTPRKLTISLSDKISLDVDVLTGSKHLKEVVIKGVKPESQEWIDKLKKSKLLVFSTKNKCYHQN